MDIKNYLFEENISQSSFAKRLGITKSYLSRIITGKQEPGRFLIEKIEFITRGKVKIKKSLKKRCDTEINEIKNCEVQNAFSEREKPKSD